MGYPQTGDSSYEKLTILGLRVIPVLTSCPEVPPVTPKVHQDFQLKHKGPGEVYC